MNKIMLVIVLSFVTKEIRSQELTNLGLGVLNYKDPSSGLLFNQLKSANQDSTKVKLLLRLCGFYWHVNKSDDSILHYSERAMDLAQNIHYKPGYFEACFLQCKINAKKGNITRAKSFLSVVPKDQQARLLLVLGEHYLFLPGEQKNNLDSAYPYLKAALSLSQTIQNLHWEHESIIALGKYYFSTGEFDKGKNSFLTVIDYFKNTGNKQKEARWWYDLALYMPDTDSTFGEELNAYKTAIQLFSELKDTAELAEVMFDLSALNRYHGRYDTSKQLIRTAIGLLKAAKKKKRYKFYYAMSTLSSLTGNLNDALFYALETLKNMEETGETNKMLLVNYQLGEIYASLNDHENSLKYFLSVKDKMADSRKCNTYAKAVEQLLKLNRPNEALKLILDYEQKFPAVRLVDRETVAGTKGDCYLALHKYKIAEKYYLEMIALDEKAQVNRKKEISSVESISGPVAYYKIGKFYVEQKEYATASRYLSRSLQTASFDNKQSYSIDLLRNIRWMQFKADSATGNYLSALQNFQKYKVINDSMFNTDRINQVERMRLAFETKEKEKNIQLLQKERLIQQESLNHNIQLKNVSIAGILLLLTVLGLLYRQFRIKQQNNRVISSKNEMLGNLLSEKEWLLKEVHHRVKNNLQIMISLLNTQSRYLESDDAIKAINESQERMQAISLIHQKLYQTDEAAYINIREYVRDLVEHIRNGFNGSAGIIFDLDVADMQLDAAQAVPLGLILNEAISNVFKYAFPGRLSGQVAISMQHSADKETLLLTITDNGIGLPANYDSTKNASFGIRLMQGLSKQMGGSFKIENNKGVKIQISFNESKVIKMMRGNTIRMTSHAV